MEQLIKEPEWWRINAAAEKVIAKHELMIAVDKIVSLKNDEFGFFTPYLKAMNIVNALVQFKNKINHLNKDPNKAKNFLASYVISKNEMISGEKIKEIFK